MKKLLTDNISLYYDQNYLDVYILRPTLKNYMNKRNLRNFYLSNNRKAYIILWFFIYNENN